MNAVARVLLACLLTVAGALTVAGCSVVQAGTSASDAPALAEEFAPADRTWIEVTMAMDEALLPLLDLVPARSGSPDVQAVALQVQAFTVAELAALRELHTRARLPRVNPHKSLPLPAMVTPDQVSKAAKTTGAEFDKLVLGALEDHLVQGRQLAANEGNAGAEPQTRTLALQAIRSRDAALTTIKEAT